MKNLIVLFAVVLLAGITYASPAVEAAEIPTFIVDSVANLDIPNFEAAIPVIAFSSAEPMSYETIEAEYGPTKSDYDEIFSSWNSNTPADYTMTVEVYLSELLCGSDLETINNFVEAAKEQGIEVKTSDPDGEISDGEEDFRYLIIDTHEKNQWCYGASSLVDSEQIE